jgi:DNA-binding beta-propeller fold protein YncE
MGLVVLGLLAALPAAAGNIAVIQKWDDSISLYDSRTGVSLAKIAAGRKPHEFAFSPDRRLAYITNYGADRWTDTSPGENTITIVDLKELQKVGQIDLGKFRRPHGIQRARSGRLYVTCDFPPTVVVVDPEARRVLQPIDVGQSLPHMVVLTADEQVAFTANRSSSRLCQFWRFLGWLER